MGHTPEPVAASDYMIFPPATPKRYAARTDKKTEVKGPAGRDQLDVVSLLNHCIFCNNETTSSSPFGCIGMHARAGQGVLPEDMAGGLDVDILFGNTARDQGGAGDGALGVGLGHAAHIGHRDHDLLDRQALRAAAGGALIVGDRQRRGEGGNAAKSMRDDLAGGGFARMVLCRCVRGCPDDFGAKICAWGLIGKTK